VAVAYDLLARRSALVALAVEDLERAPDGSATVLIRRSKTDPEGTGVPLYLAPDTMAYLEAWLTAAGRTTAVIYFAPLGDGRALKVRVVARPEKFAETAPTMKHSIDTLRLLDRQATAQ